MASGNIYNLFLISQALEGNLKRPYISFVEKGYNEAKLYFKAFIEAERKSEEILKQAPMHYVLHQVGEIDKTFCWKPKFIYITDSYALFKYDETGEKAEVSQLSIELAGKNLSYYKMWQQNRDYNDKIRSLFNGKYV